MTDSESLDTADTDDVFQEDAPPYVVPVEVKGVVRTDDMPTETSYINIILPTGGNAEKILNDDPRRKRVVIWALPLGAGVEFACIGRESDAQSFRGAMLFSQNAVTRYEFTDKKAIYARPGDITSSGGTWQGYTASTDDIIICMAVEQWTR